MKHIAFALCLFAAVPAFAQSYHDVEPGHFHTYANGFIIGRPVRASTPGLILPTMEMEINMGSYPDSSHYIGTTMAVSTENPDVFRRFQELDPSQTYVFQYYRRHNFNPEWEATHYMIAWIWPMGTHESLAASSRTRAESHTSRGTGWASSGTRSGRIVHVERWGFTSTVCEITVNLGGMGGSGHDHEENTFRLNTYTEEACSFAEDMLRHGYDVQVDYSQDMFEMWDYTDYIAHAIHRTESGVVVDGVTVSQEVVDAVSERLLNDPEFIAEVRRRALATP